MESPLKPIKKPERVEKGAVLPSKEKFAFALKVYNELYGCRDIDKRLKENF
jgi:hypothetical protein